MPAKKISELEELAEAPADDDLFAVVDVSDLSTATGTTKKIKASNLAPPPLSYPTAHHYVDAGSIAPGGHYVSLGAGTLTDPEGWRFGDYFYVPDGIYSLSWYWETSAGDGGEWDNYISASGCGPDPSYGFYPTAPPAHPDSYWGSGSAVLKFYDEAGVENWFAMVLVNRSAGDLPLKSWFSVTRLDT